MIPLLLALRSFQTVKNLYKSNLDEQEHLLLECFLLLLTKQASFGWYKDNNYKQDIELLVRSTSNHDLLNLFVNQLQPVCKKSGKLFFNNLFISARSTTEKSNKAEFLETFDGLLKNYFGNHYGGDALQPKEITDLLNTFMQKKEEISYYNPFGGLASLALDLSEKVNYHGEELNHFTWVLAKMRMLAYDCPVHFQFENINSIENWHHTGTGLYDFICFNPPFNLKLDRSFPHFLNDEEFGDHRNVNSLIVSQTFRKLKEGGKMAFVMPNGFLSSNSTKDKALRKYLVDNNFLEAVILLPARILGFTSIQVNVIVLSKDSSDQEVKFVDASKFTISESGKMNIIDLPRIFEHLWVKKSTDFSRVKNSEEIKESDYSLLVGRYVYEEPEINREDEENLVQLKRLIVPLPKYGTHFKRARLITIRELSEDSLFPFLEIEKLPLKEVKPSFSAVRQKVLLLSLLGNKMKPTVVVPAREEILYTRGNIMAFHIKEDQVLTEYLVAELHKDYVKNQIKALTSGSGIPRISRSDLLDNVKIICPSKKTQERRVDQFYFRAQQKKEVDSQELATANIIDVADENSFLRHQIAGSMKNLRNAFKLVKKILDNEVESRLPELYALKANEKLPSTLGDYMEMIDRDLGSITKTLNKAGTEIELTDLEIEKVDLIRFVKNYKTELESRNGNHFSIEIKKDEAALLENSVKTVYIHADKEKLRQMMDNIVGNAVKHGFGNRIGPSNKIVFEFIYDFKNAEVQLDISNSGNPLPEDYSHEAFIRKGSSSGKNAGDGTGGWLIKEIMKLHNGHFGFTDETGSEGIKGDLVTSIELTFPIIIKQ